MRQADRDRLVALKKTKKKLITQREAAEELGVSFRQVLRLLIALNDRGDKAVVHGLRGSPQTKGIAKSFGPMWLQKQIQNQSRAGIDCLPSVGPDPG